MKATLAIACLLAPLAFGQMAHMRFESNGDTTTITFSAPSTNYEIVTIGKPYSAEQVSESVQTLADGAHIRQPVRTTKLWRDLDGRTRSERPLVFGEKGTSGFTTVELRDPVAGLYYILDEQNKVAHRYALPAPAKLGTPPVVRDSKAQATLAQYKTERLGSESIEGVMAEGTRTTRTMPVGEIGNDQQITTTNESWFSRDLSVSVLFKSTDPRMGEHTTRLTNISRAAPDAALFQPPADYKVVDEKDSFSISYKRR